MDSTSTYSAFYGSRRLITGTLECALREVKRFSDMHPNGCTKNDGTVLVFNDELGQQVDFDLRGPIEEVLRKALVAPARLGPGRPRLGVVSREISLLPRHWEWLECQPNGASAALRRLVEDARKDEDSDQTVRARIEAVGRVMTALAGNLPGFEEACRGLYRRDLANLTQSIEDWPPDIRAYIFDHATVGQSDKESGRSDNSQQVNWAG
jgi:hypothetical protein